MNRPCLALLLLVAPSLLRAQETAVFSEDAFLAAATASRSAESVLTSERDLAAAEVLRASLWPNPTLEASREQPGRSVRETSAAVAWTPPFDGRRKLRQEAARIGLDAATKRLEGGRFALRRRLRTIYAEWAMAWDGRALLIAHLDRVAELARRAREQAKAGEIPGLVARRFSLEEAQVRADLGRAEARLAVARGAVAAWAPEISASSRPITPRLPSVDPAPADLAGRPDLAALGREVERAETLRTLSGKLWEMPVLGLGWKRIEERSQAADGPVFSAGWTIPLFDRRRADRLESEARLSSARGELDLVSARASAEAFAARDAYDRLRAEALAAEQVAEETGDLLIGATAAYQQGESSLTDLLDAFRSGLGAHLTTLELRDAALAALRDLEAALGRPLLGDLP